MNAPPNPADFLLLTGSIARKRWLKYVSSTRNILNLCLDDFQSAANFGLFEAHRRWRPNVAGCGNKKCTVDDSGLCPHGHGPCVFATIAGKWINGAISHLIRGEFSKYTIRNKYAAEIGIGDKEAINTGEAYRGDKKRSILTNKRTTRLLHSISHESGIGASVARAARQAGIASKDDVENLIDDIIALSEGKNVATTGRLKTVLEVLRILRKEYHVTPEAK